MSAKHWILIGLAVTGIGIAGFMLLSQGSSDLETDQVGGSTLSEPSNAIVPVTPNRIPIKTTAFEAEDEDFTEDGVAANTREAILVVDDQERPVKGVQVGIYRTGAGFGFRARMTGEDSSSPARAEATTDEHGLATFTRRDLRGRNTRVRARLGDRVGFQRLTQDDLDEPPHPNAVAVITLKPIRRIVVSVKDAAGLPAGHVQVRVTAAAGTNSRGRRRGGPWGSSVRGWTTAKTGATVLSITPEQEALYSAERIDVSAQLYGIDPVRKTTAFNEQRDTDVELTIPTGVVIDVHLKGPDGKPFQENVLLQWNIQKSTEDGGEGRSQFRRFFRETGRRSVSNGRVQIGGFPVGVKVVFKPLPTRRVLTQTVVSLPSSPGQIAADVEIGAVRPILIVQLNEPDGTAAANRRFRTRITRDTDEETDWENDPSARIKLERSFMNNLMRGDGNVRSDKRGIVEVPLDPGVGGTLQIEDSNRRRGFRGRGGSRNQDTPPLASVSFSGIDPGERRELGSLALDRGTLMIAGHVLNGEGAGVARMRVSVASTRVSDDNSSNENRRSRRGRRRSRGLSSMTDAEGHFKIFAPIAENRRWTVSGRGRGAAVAPVAFEPGVEDLALKAVTTGGISGRIRLANPKLDLRIEMRIESEERGSNDRPVTTRRVSLGKQGKFRTTNLVPGSYTCSVRLEGFTTREFKGILVPDGKTQEPAELADLVVGQDFVEGVVQVQDDQGSPIDGARIMVQYTAQNAGGFRFRGTSRTNESGQGSVVVRSGQPMRLTVFSNKYQMKSLTDPQFPVTATLIKPAVIEIALNPALPTIEGLTSYRLTLRRKDTSSDSRQSSRFMRRMGGTRSSRIKPGQSSVTIKNVSDGDYTVALELRARSGAERPSRRASVPLGEIAVTRGSQNQFTFNLEPTALTAALEAAPARPAPNERGRTRNNRRRRNR